VRRIVFFAFALHMLCRLRSTESYAMPKPSPEAAERLRAFEHRCRQAGFPLTVQRRVILETMVLRDDHPTAEQIYETIRPRVPEISRATVYRVLESLVRLGAIGRAHHFGSTARFDSNTSHHHHLVCVRCNRVIDFEDAQLDDLPLPDHARTGFLTTDYSIHFTGLCAECQQADSTPAPREAAK
jgi:Fur family transcriptional regulator, peroxide stress response regulator